jgi:simple sugar transport system permease protein
LHFLKKYSLKRADFIQFAVIGVLFAISYIKAVETFLFADRLLLLHAVTIGLIAAAVYELYNIIRRKFIQKEQGFSILNPVLIIILCAALYAATYIPEVEKVLMSVKLPVLPFLLIAALCLFNQKILDTRLGQNMRTVGQSQSVALASGIDVDKTRVIAMIISTVLASWGQLIYLQNIGTFSTYGAHTQIAQFAIAALLVGGASVQKATNKQAIIGVILFHTLFIVAPQAGKNLFDNAQIGEYFRVFVSYGVIALSLAMHAWKMVDKKSKDPLKELDSPDAQQGTPTSVNAS